MGRQIYSGRKLEKAPWESQKRRVEDSEEEMRRSNWGRSLGEWTVPDAWSPGHLTHSWYLLCLI